MDDWGSYEKGYMWNPSMCDCECKKACKFDEYLDITNCSCKIRLIVKLVLECEDKTSKTIETLLDVKKLACAKINCLIHTISLVIICFLLLVVVCVSCYSYYTKYRPKQKDLLPF